jgi:DNA-binding IclR family transcriptional regulator
MKRARKKPATDRKFVVALSRGLDVLRAFHPQDGLLGNQEIAARTRLPKPTVSRLTYTLTKLGYLAQVSRFDKYQLAPPAMAIGYAALANLGIRDLAEPHMRKLAKETGGDVALGARDRTSMIYLAQSHGSASVNVALDVGSRIPIATTAAGRAYLFALPDDRRAELMENIRERAGSRWPKVKAGLERAAEGMAKHGFAVSAGEWMDDVHAVGAALKLNDGTGPYAFNCGAPAYKFSQDKLHHEIGPRLVAMVRNIEAVLNGTSQSPAAPSPVSKSSAPKNGAIKTATNKTGSSNKKLKSGGKVAREIQGIR